MYHTGVLPDGQTVDNLLAADRSEFVRRDTVQSMIDVAIQTAIQTISAAADSDIQDVKAEFEEEIERLGGMIRDLERREDENRGL